MRRLSSARKPWRSAWTARADDACLNDAKTDAAIQKDVEDGSAQGVRGTPAFLIVKTGADGQKPKAISGALPFDQFAQAIEQVIAGQ